MFCKEKRSRWGAGGPPADDQAPDASFDAAERRFRTPQQETRGAVVLRRAVIGRPGAAPRTTEPAHGDPGGIQYEGSGADRDRTDDLLHAMQALSQLSYSPIERGN